MNLKQVGVIAFAALTVAAANAVHGFAAVVDANYCRTVSTPCVLVGPTQTFKTIQSAVKSLDETTAYTIVVLSGVYNEQVNVTRKGPLTLRGQTAKSEDANSNTVNVTWASANGSGNKLSDNAFTAVLTVAPNLNASLTGSGPTGWPVLSSNPFGNVNFRVYNINFLNTYSTKSSGPSLALSIGYANASFYRTGWYSYQDTIYVGKQANAYFKDSIIAGETDFLYGFGTAWIENSTLSLRGCGGGITAWKGTNTTFANAYGVYISNSKLLKAPGLTTNIAGKCALGRPWNSGHRSIYSNTYMDASIQPGGYIPWSKSDTRIVDGVTLLAEYQSSGPGFNLTARQANSKVGKVLTAAQFAPYDGVEKVFKFPFSGTAGNTAWITGGDQ